MLNKNLTLGEFIIKNQASFKYSSGELSSLINSIRLAAKIVNHEVNKAGLVDIIGETGGENIQFEKQQKLDVYANEKFIKTLINRNIVCGIASEEEDSFISINSIDKNNQNKYVVLIDPLDGSSNIDVNVSVGTIFSIYRRKSKIGSEVELDDFFTIWKRSSCGRIYNIRNFNYAGIQHRKRSKRIYVKSRNWNILSFAFGFNHSRKWKYILN